MRQVLITGGTGAIGSALVPLFLNDERTEVHLLLRAQGPGQLEERLGGLMTFWGIEPDCHDLRRRIHVHAGDVCQPRLGLDADAWRRLTGQLTHMIHCAGNVKLNQTLVVARAAAVDSVRRVVELVQACRRNGRFEKLDVVSTIGVAGRMPGAIPETSLTVPRQFRNTYEAAKAEAEQLLEAEIQAGLPATIHRPSMVVGDSRTGRIVHFQVFYYLCEFLTGRRTHGLLPELGRFRLDTIPVDCVARLLYASSARPDAIGRVFHLCAGPEGTLGLGELAERLRQIYADHGKRLPRLRHLPARRYALLAKLLEWVAPSRMRRALQTLPHFLAYLDQEQTFETTRTREFFAADAQAPRVEHYLGRLIDYFETARAKKPHLSPSA